MSAGLSRLVTTVGCLPGPGRINGRSWLGPKLARFYLLPVLLAITACTSTPVAVCPAIVDYSPGIQAEAADEILALPPGSVLVQFMQDYASLRARLRECQP